MSNKLQPHKRRKARQMALQALYQWHIGGDDIRLIEAQFCADNDMSKIDTEYLQALLRGTVRSAHECDQCLTPLLDRSIDQLDPIERCILRIGVFELQSRLDVPYRVVMNESIELAKRFGGSGSHRYINGILDKLAPKLRATEIRRHNP